MALPIKNGKISTPFGKVGKHWSTGKHTGVDFAVPIGTPVLAVADGIITTANWGKAYGIQVVQRVAKGYVIYAHLNAVRVKAPQIVRAGQIIGESGSTGNSTGPHLHLEYRDNVRWSNGKPIDPKDLLKGQIMSVLEWVANSPIASFCKVFGAGVLGWLLINADTLNIHPALTIGLVSALPIIINWLNPEYKNYGKGNE